MLYVVFYFFPTCQVRVDFIRVTCSSSSPPPPPPPHPLPTLSSRFQWALLDLNCELRSGHSTTLQDRDADGVGVDWVPHRKLRRCGVALGPNTCQRDCQTECQIECQIKCQIKSQNECLKRCQIECQIECVRKNARKNVR